MSGQLAISIGQYSDKGRKEVNQDFHGAVIPQEPLLGLKGVAVVLADGISSSEVGGIASESAVKSFLTDYYCTPDAWQVKLSAQRVIVAANSWLHSQTRQNQYVQERDRGYVCTLSAMVLRSNTAHIFHVGDARIYRVAGKTLEQLTEDHRVVVSSEQSYLGRALGINQQVEIDYRALPLQSGDTFVLATDGIHEHVNPHFIAETIERAGDLDTAARVIGEEALHQGSPDNLTVQIVRVDALPDGEANDIIGRDSDLPCPPLLDARANFDGYEIVREIHASSRSHIYLAIDGSDGATVVLKTPSLDLREDRAYLQRFRMEEWVARRIDSPHVLKPRAQARRRNYLYIATEFVEGRTLTQWMRDNPKPDLGAVRDIVEQIARGLQAFHRMDMLHQDLRPENVMIDRTGTAKIIDFGSTRISGIADGLPETAGNEVLGTVQYTAPEYFLGEGGSQRSDIYSLGVIAYQMLTGTLPYGAAAAKVRTKAQQRRLAYRPMLDENREIPAWFDAALRKAVDPDPLRRYGELSEFIFDLQHPNLTLRPPQPLIERNPLLFWKGLSALLFVLLLIALGARLLGH